MDQLLNFFQATGNIGTSGQPTREQFKQIAAQGYSSVVNLAMHNSDNAIADEGNIVAALGMSYVHIPVPFDHPTVEHVNKFIRVMNALEGEKVLVHCALNARVSAFIFKYLTICKGQAEDASTSPLLQQWLPSMDEAWKTIINLRASDLESGRQP